MISCSYYRVLCGLLWLCATGYHSEFLIISSILPGVKSRASHSKESALPLNYIPRPPHLLIWGRRWQDVWGLGDTLEKEWGTFEASQERSTEPGYLSTTVPFCSPLVVEYAPSSSSGHLFWHLKVLNLGRASSIQTSKSIYLQNIPLLFTKTLTTKGGVQHSEKNFFQASLTID